MKDSQEDARDEVCQAIRKGSKQAFRELLERLEGCFPEGGVTKAFLESSDYILSNWMAARCRLVKMEGCIGSSTEGHVSHVLANRMSTCAMGWSPLGADQMAQLRTYHLNGGDMLELVRFQKTELPKAAGAEELVTANDILVQERRHHSVLGKYHDAITHSIAVQDKKKIWFESHIWSL